MNFSRKRASYYCAKSFLMSKVKLGRRFAGIFKILGIVLLIGVFLVGFYALSLTGPNRDWLGLNENENRVINPEQAKALQTESEAAEQAFNDALRVRNPNEQDLETLKKAVDLQREALRVIGGADAAMRTRLNELTKLYDNQASSGLSLEAERLERLGMEAELDEDSEAALEAFRESLRLQREINDKFPNSNAYDVRRITRLERKVRTYEAEPMFQRSLAAEQRAREAMEEEDWEVAEEELALAMDLQKRINERYRGVRQASVRRHADLERDFFSLKSSDLSKRIETLIEEADTAMDRDAHTEAAEAYQLAQRLQEELNESYPLSRFASIQQVDNLRQMREEAHSAGLAMDIHNDFKRLDALLAEGKVFEIMEILPTLSRKTEVFRERFPNSTRIDEKDLSKVQYLRHIANDIGFYQDRISSMLLEVPGMSNVRMLRTEVPQALYASIMGTNPSRMRDDRLPVDSIIWDEAIVFAERISWILGKPCRLPSREEFEAAVGSLRYVSIEDIAWCNTNSDGNAQPVGLKEANAHGFQDLLGNVSEWLMPSGFLGSTEAYLAGGSAVSSTDSLASVPMEIASRRSRNIRAGFRIVVEWAAPAP